MAYAKSRKNKLMLAFVVVVVNVIAVKHPSFQVIGGAVDAIALIVPGFK